MLRTGHPTSLKTQAAKISAVGPLPRGCENPRRMSADELDDLFTGDVLVLHAGPTPVGVKGVIFLQKDGRLNESLGDDFVACANAGDGLIKKVMPALSCSRPMTFKGMRAAPPQHKM